MSEDQQNGQNRKVSKRRPERPASKARGPLAHSLLQIEDDLARLDQTQLFPRGALDRVRVLAQRANFLRHSSVFFDQASLAVRHLTHLPPKLQIAAKSTGVGDGTQRQGHGRGKRHPKDFSTRPHASTVPARWTRARNALPSEWASTHTGSAATSQFYPTPISAGGPTYFRSEFPMSAPPSKEAPGGHTECTPSRRTSQN